MEIKIKQYTNTNFFVYNKDTLEVIIEPKHLDAYTTTTTCLYPNYIEVEKSTMEELLLEFDKLGLKLKDEIVQYFE